MQQTVTKFLDMKSFMDDGDMVSIRRGRNVPGIGLNFLLAGIQDRNE